MQKEVETKEIKNTINKMINIFAYQPQKIYPRIITKNEVDVIVDMDNELIKLSCRTWQDDYFNKLVERANLEILTFPCAGEGEEICMGTQYDPIIDEKHLEKGIIRQPDEIYVIIEKTINSIYQIKKYYEKKKELEKESADISPGSPMDRLNEEFYGKIEELMLK